MDIKRSYKGIIGMGIASFVFAIFSILFFACNLPFFATQIVLWAVAFMAIGIIHYLMQFSSMWAQTANRILFVTYIVGFVFMVITFFFRPENDALAMLISGFLLSFGFTGSPFADYLGEEAQPKQKQTISKSDKFNKTKYSVTW